LWLTRTWGIKIRRRKYFFFKLSMKENNNKNNKNLKSNCRRWCEHLALDFWLKTYEAISFKSQRKRVREKTITSISLWICVSRDDKNKKYKNYVMKLFFFQVVEMKTIRLDVFLKLNLTMAKKMFNLKRLCLGFSLSIL
jgi:hypothetical protein